MKPAAEGRSGGEGAEGQLGVSEDLESDGVSLSMGELSQIEMQKGKGELLISCEGSSSQSARNRTSEATSAHLLPACFHLRFPPSTSQLARLAPSLPLPHRDPAIPAAIVSETISVLTCRSAQIWLKESTNRRERDAWEDMGVDRRRKSYEGQRIQ